MLCEAIQVELAPQLNTASNSAVANHFLPKKVTPVRMMSTDLSIKVKSNKFKISKPF